MEGSLIRLLAGEAARSPRSATPTGELCSRPRRTLHIDSRQPAPPPPSQPANGGGRHGLTRGLTRGRKHDRARGLTNGPTHSPTSGPARVGLPVGQTVSGRFGQGRFAHGTAHGGRNPALRGRHHGIVHGTAHLGLNPGLHGIHHGIMRVAGDHLPHDVGAVPRAVPSAVLGAGGVSS